VKQWIIDRYNEGQDKWKIKAIEEKGENNGVVIGKDIAASCYNIPYYDFLFNPKWGFAKAFWGKYHTIHCQDNYMCRTNQKWIEGYEYQLQQMAISKDPLKYLEQFKDE
jgi:hypothetical protein